MSAPARNSPAAPTEQQVQEELMRLDAYRGQLNAMVQQYQYLAGSRSEHVRARETLEGLEKIDPQTEVLIPVGGETFVRGIPARDAPVLVGIGSGVVVELPRPKVSEILAERLKKIDEASQELEGQIRALEERVQVLSQRLDSMTRGGAGPESGAAGDVGSD